MGKGEKKLPPQLNIYPVAEIPHNIRNFRAIIGLSFKLFSNGFEIPSANKSTRYIAKQ